MNIEQIAEKSELIERRIYAGSEIPKKSGSREIYTVCLNKLIRLIRYTDCIFYASNIYHWDDLEFPEPLVTAGEQVTFENLCKLIDNGSIIKHVTVMKR